jgi:hypothetical protein
MKVNGMGLAATRFREIAKRVLFNERDSVKIVTQHTSG